MTHETAWQKSSFSSDEDAPNCLEIAADTATIHLRESETPTARLTTTRPRLASLIRTLKSPALGPRGPQV
ncbi:DUF397 domain-containing protein [Streptomyces sp. DSM 118878]